MKKTLITLMIILLTFLTSNTEARVTMRTIAYVNLLSSLGFDAAYDMDSEISTTRFGSDACGQAKASIKRLEANAYSYGAGLMHPGVGMSFISLVYNVVGNMEGIPLPITITAKIQGDMNAYTAAGDFGSVAQGRVAWTTYDGNSDWGTIVSQAGIPMIQKHMSGEVISVTIDPKIRVGIGKMAIEIALNKEDLESLGFDPEIVDYSNKEEWNAAAATLAKAVLTYGLAYHGLDPGLVVKAGFDATVHVTKNLEASQIVCYNGVFILGVNAVASASCFPAHGMGKIMAKIEPISATVPSNFPYDISNISLNIDGKNIPVERSN